MAGEPIQIVSLNPQTKEFDLNLEKVQEILLHENIKDRDVAVVSITGLSRKGRSFLLNIILRYLNEVYENGNELWLSELDTPLTGFAWGSGSKPKTKGIWIWSKIFTHTKQNGQKIGVMLMDSQGVFDGSSKIRDNITIFSLNSMLSSCQLYNISENIQDDNLYKLFDFIQYARMYKEQTNLTAFQQLLFLVRDWGYSYELPYGLEGGNENLNELLAMNEDDDDDMKVIRSYIRTAYEKLDGYLMANPGRAATSSRTFTGQMKEISNDFRNNLKDLIPLLLSPENISIKNINGDCVKGKSLVLYFQIYWEIFGKGKRPPPAIILKATSFAYMHALLAEVVESFIVKFTKITDDSKPFISFNEMVAKFDESMHYFNLRTNFADDELVEAIRSKLKLNLNGYFFYFAQKNDMKRTQNFLQTLDNLIEQSSTFPSKTDDQRDLMAFIKAEAQKIKSDIGSQPGPSQTIVDPPKPTLFQIAVHELQKFGSSVSDETGNFIGGVEHEAAHLGSGIQNVAENVGKELTNLGEGISHGISNIGTSLENEAGHLASAISNIELPTIELPKIEIPHIEPPRIEIPHIDVPNINIGGGGGGCSLM